MQQDKFTQCLINYFMILEMKMLVQVKLMEKDKHNVLINLH